MTCTHTSRGFTLVELLIVVSVALLLLGTTVWSMGDALPGYRTNSAAQRFVLDTRNALAVAARANQPVHLVKVAEDGGCADGYRIVQGADPDEPARVLDTVCMTSEYPGVALEAAGITAGVQCADDQPATALSVCSFCEAGARLTFYPTGEVVAVAAGGGVQAGGHSAVFVAKRGEDRAAKALAVGVRSGTGRARVYRREPTSAFGWVCQ
jgi:prepilin-type N-terminal cleavage/methylation domain-containing protein